MNREKTRTPLTLFSTWPGDPIVVRLLLAGSQSPGFMSYSTSNYRMNFFAVAKSSVSGPSNDMRPNLGNTRHLDGWRLRQTPQSDVSLVPGLCHSLCDKMIASASVGPPAATFARASPMVVLEDRINHRDRTCEIFQNSQICGSSPAVTIPSPYGRVHARYS